MARATLPSILEDPLVTFSLRLLHARPVHRDDSFHAVDEDARGE